MTQAEPEYNDAREIDPKARIVRCRQLNCRAPIWWGRTRVNNRVCPFDVTDGQRTATSHWRTCIDRPARQVAFKFDGARR